MLQDDPVMIALPMGLGMPEFNRPGLMRLIEAHRRKQKHIDIYNICESLEKYLVFPSTFDGSLPSEQGGARRRVQIGETYLFEGIGGPDGTVGTVTSATVNVAEKKAYIAITRMEGGSSLILTEPMSDDALSDYKTHGDAYFGQLGRPKRREISSTFELFERLMEIYAKTPRDKLLDWMKDAPNYEELRQMPDDDELRANYCEMIAYASERADDEAAGGQGAKL
jgi:hypothetical protein